MDIEVTGGPAYPTLSGGQIDEKTWRWEGMVLFDYYAAAAITAGKTPKQAAKVAQDMLALRKELLYTKAN